MLVPKLRFKREDGTEYPEWKKTKIGKLAKTFSASRVHREEWQKEGVPFWRSSDVMAFHQHKENAMGKAFITKELYEKLSAKSGKMMKDDILITGGGSIGVPYLIPDNKPLYVKDADLLCIQKSDNHYPKFLYQFFWSPSFRNYLGIISHKGTIAHYTIKQINETPIIMPCLEEQQKIADFLSTVDEVIAQSEAEVQNLEQQKKAAIQKIFSQEVRFKREDGTDYPEWKTMKISDFTVSHNAGIYIAKNDYGKGINIIGVGDIYDTDIIEDQQYRLAPVDNPDYILDYGDLVYGESSLVPEGIARTVCIGKKGVGSAFAWHTRRYKVDTNVIEPHFLVLQINYSHTVHRHLMRVCTQTALTGMTTEEYFGTKVAIPCLEEQQRIADFLSAYDEAISYAKQELDKWKELKKGLLQQMFV